MKDAKIFEAILKDRGIELPAPEYVFARPRRWRFDYAWVRQKVALEVEGGVFTGGRHTRGAGFIKDMEKYNEAAALCWRVVRCTPKQLCSVETVLLLERLLKNPGPWEDEVLGGYRLKWVREAVDDEAVDSRAEGVTMGDG